jgi:hypothetical protein
LENLSVIHPLDGEAIKEACAANDPDALAVAAHRAASRQATYDEVVEACGPSAKITPGRVILGRTTIIDMYGSIVIRKQYSW